MVPITGLLSWTNIAAIERRNRLAIPITGRRLRPARRVMERMAPTRNSAMRKAGMRNREGSRDRRMHRTTERLAHRAPKSLIRGWLRTTERAIDSVRHQGGGLEGRAVFAVQGAGLEEGGSAPTSAARGSISKRFAIGVSLFTPLLTPRPPLRPLS